MNLSKLQQDVINQYQKGFPVCSRPYQVIADEFDVSEQEVISTINELEELGLLSRVGPVFDHKKAGASTLAALAVPEEELDGVAEIVNRFEQVNHNYAREHRYNLWFVVTAADFIKLGEVLKQIEQLTGYEVLVLPMETDYHIDLGFKINFNDPKEQ